MVGFWRNLFGVPEKRSITEVPWDAQLPFNQMPGLLYGGEMSQSRALALAPVYAANRVLADTISTLPLKSYRKVGEDRIPITMPPLFANLQADGQLVPWLYRAVTSLGLRGNAYGWIIGRDGYGYPTQIEWLNPSDVQADERPGETGWFYQGRPIPRADIVHIPWFVLAGKRCGLSPIASFANTIGVGLQAQAYASDWFGAGGFPPGTFKNVEQTITQTQADEIKGRLGAAMRSREPLVYGRDWDYSPISVPPEEAQFVETMKLTANQIAPIYGVQPEDIGGTSGDSMTYANVEQKAINRVMFGYRPWLVRFEAVFASILPAQQYVLFNADALVRADLQTRWNVNKIRWEMGAVSIDEIRAQEDMPPLPNGQGQKYGPPPAIANPPQDQANPTTPLRRIQ